MGSRGEAPVGGLGDEVPPKLHGSLLHNKNRIYDLKMQLNFNFCLHFVRTHNTIFTFC